MSNRRFSNVIGFDDAPFERSERGKIALVGTVCSGTRLDVVLRDFVTRNGNDSTEVMAKMVEDDSLGHVRAVMLQGITCAGMNIVDIHHLSERLSMPVLVVMRKMPNFARFFEALDLQPDREHKRSLIDRAGLPEPLGPLWAQRAGLTHPEALDMLARTTLHGVIPEPLRLAHLIAGGMTSGRSRGRA